MKQLILPILMTIFVVQGFTSDRLGKGEDDRPTYKIRKVVIDPGHGGKDPGTMGDHSKEKEIVLLVAKKLGGYIKQYFPEIEVIYTRSDDTFIKLEERSAIANRKNADLFISLHCNAAENKQAYGTETWVMGMHKTQTNLEVAKRENSVILLEDDYETAYEYDPNDPLSHIVFSLYQNAYIDQSLTLADYIQDQFRERVNRRDRGVHQAGFVVLYRATMPAVLVEMGFLSNQAEERFLLSDKGQDLVASGIFRAFRDYKNQMEGAADNIGPSKGSIAIGPQPEDTTPVPDDIDVTLAEKDVEFRLQVAVRSTTPDFTQLPYDNRSGFHYVAESSGLFRVFYGHFASPAEAEGHLMTIRNTGFPDAFVVAYKGNKQVDMESAVSQNE